jgi:hypothetical protein
MTRSESGDCPFPPSHAVSSIRGVSKMDFFYAVGQCLHLNPALVTRLREVAFE